jgi:hypothetical protein
MLEVDWEMEEARQGWKTDPLVSICKGYVKGWAGIDKERVG